MTNPRQLRAVVYGRQSRGKTKSIDEQLAEGAEVCEEENWALTGQYQDGSSASRFAAKGRDDWPRVLELIANGELDILILWESSRGDRTLTTWSGMLDLCRDQGVRIHIINDERLYDPRKPRDWKSLAQSGVDSAGESDLISARVLRGQAGAARAGRPAHGRVPYGYVRRYDPTTGELVGQEPHPDRAAVVREVFTRIAKGDPVSVIVADLNRRRVPTSGDAKQWYRARLRLMARNRVYNGEREHRGNVTEGTWPQLVDTETWYAVQRVLNDPRRVTTRPGRALHLLSYIGTAVPCGGPLFATQGRYRCDRDGCVTIDQATADDIVNGQMIAWLSRSDIYAALRRQGDDANQAVTALQSEIAQLQGRLNEWRLSAARGETSPASLAIVEAELTGQIAAAQRRVVQADIPPELQAILEPGADVRTRWMDAPIAARRRVISVHAEVALDRAVVARSRVDDIHRLGRSRWVGDGLTWGERWVADVA